eukprot:COSAG05_NODE_17489_length_324_cov_1.004444_1_plen_81_part_01
MYRYALLHTVYWYHTSTCDARAAARALTVLVYCVYWVHDDAVYTCVQLFTAAAAAALCVTGDGSTPVRHVHHVRGRGRATR